MPTKERKRKIQRKKNKKRKKDRKKEKERNEQTNKEKGDDERKKQDDINKYTKNKVKRKVWMIERKNMLNERNKK